MTAHTNTSHFAPAPGVTLDMILDTVCDRMDRSRADVVDGAATAQTLRARHIAMWLARRLLMLPHAQIGAMLAGRGGDQVMNAEARVNALRLADPTATMELNALELEVRALGLAAERLALPLRSVVDPIAVARRVAEGGRAATQVSLAEIVALARHVLQHTPMESAHV